MIHYGGVPVPFSVSWTGEEAFHVALCLHGGGMAICQAEARGEGKPMFGKPHAQRQRKVIRQSLCDLCAKPLAARTKVSLSHARPAMNGHKIGDILQFEALLHRECAAISLRHCPSLKRDIRDGTLMVRQVTRYQTQVAVMSSEYTESITGTAVKALGHAKVQLLKWIDRDADWLEAEKALT